MKELKAVTSIRIATAVLQGCRDRGINISQFCEKALKQEIRGKTKENAEESAIITEWKMYREKMPLLYGIALSRIKPEFPGIFENPVFEPSNELKMRFVRAMVQYIRLLKKKKVAKKKNEAVVNEQMP